MERLKELRKDRGLKQSDLAAHFKVDRTTFTKYETGDREPDFKMLHALADFFDVSTDYLLGRTNAKNPRVIQGKKKEIHLQLKKNEGADFMINEKVMFVNKLAEKIQKLAIQNSLGKYEVIEERAAEIAEGINRHIRGESRVALAKKAVIELELTEEEKEHFTLNEVIAAANEIRDTDEAAEESRVKAEYKKEERVRLYGEVSDNEIQLLDCFRQLNASGQGKVYEYTDDLVLSGKYTLK